MKARYRMFRRGSVFWCQNNQTGKQETLRTKDREIALRLLHSKNEAHEQPAINLQIARAYLVATDPAIARCAEVELNHLRHQHGVALLNPRISKNGKGKSGTYTVAYTLRQSNTERLF